MTLDRLVSPVGSVGASRLARGCHWQPAPLERSVLLFGEMLAAVLQVTPELCVCI